MGAPNHRELDGTQAEFKMPHPVGKPMDPIAQYKGALEENKASTNPAAIGANLELGVEAARNAPNHRELDSTQQAVPGKVGNANGWFGLLNTTLEQNSERHAANQSNSEVRVEAARNAPNHRELDGTQA